VFINFFLFSMLYIIRKQMFYVAHNIQEAISEGNEWKGCRKKQSNRAYESTNSFKICR